MSITRAIKTRGFGVIIKHLILRPIAGLIYCLPYSPLRILVLNIFGAKVSFNATIHNVHFINMELGSFSNLIIEDDVHVAEDSLIDLFGKVTLKKWSIVSPRAIILTHSSPGAESLMLKYYPEKIGNVTLENSAWVGANATILSGITIGEMAVVGAGSVVTKDVAKKSVVGGVPAKLIKRLK